jgi:hypothetical protein
MACYGDGFTSFFNTTDIHHFLTQGLLEKSKSAQHAYEEGHYICCKEAKDKGNLPTSLTDHLKVNPSLDISPLWNSIITAESQKLKLHPV